MTDSGKWPCPECDGAGKVRKGLSDIDIEEYMENVRAVQLALWANGSAYVTCTACNGTGKYRHYKRAVVQQERGVKGG